MASYDYLFVLIAYYYFFSFCFMFYTSLFVCCQPLHAFLFSVYSLSLLVLCPTVWGCSCKKKKYIREKKIYIYRPFAYCVDHELADISARRVQRVN